MSRAISLGCIVVVAVIIGTGAGVWISSGLGFAESPARDNTGGICVYSNHDALTQSATAEKANANLQHLAQQIKDQIESRKEQLEKERREFQAKASDMDSAEHEEQTKALQKKQHALLQQTNLLAARLRYTQTTIRKQIDKVIEPLVKQAFEASDCHILLKSEAVLARHQVHDLTPAVTKALDAKVTSIHFKLLSLPSQKADQHETEKG